MVGAYNIIEKMNVKKLLIPPQLKKNRQYLDIISIAKRRKTQIIMMVDFKKIVDGKIEIEAIFPEKFMSKYILKNATNNNSLVVKISIKDVKNKKICVNTKINVKNEKLEMNKINMHEKLEKIKRDDKITILYTGDIEKIAEEQILNNDEKFKNRSRLKDIDILKVAHHGSISSSIEKFIKKVRPEFATISCGINNKFKHPSKIVLDRFNKMNTKIFRTDLNGEISFKLE